MALFGLLGGKKTSVGLDIGSGIIKLAVIDHSGSEPELIKVATTEGAADAIVEGEVMDPGLVAEAIRRLFSTPGAKRGGAGLVNIGHEVASVRMLDDGVSVLARDLSVGTRRFREDLQREKGLSAEDSEGVIQGQAQSGDLAQYVDARGEEIAVGVERAAAFLATASRSAGGLGRVYTIGGGARVPGLNEALSNRLRVPVELASPVQRLKVRDSVFESVAVDEVAPLLMLSVGLALRRAA